MMPVATINPPATLSPYRSIHFPLNNCAPECATTTNPTMAPIVATSYATTIETVSLADSGAAANKIGMTATHGSAQ